MIASNQPFYLSLGSLGDAITRHVPVTLSPELIGLLSEQLYRSPSKAIEELVINGFDAEADESWVFVPEPGSEAGFIVVFDDGVGMTYDGIADLWKVGRRKVRDERVFERKQRRQIGKFGIGKLSTYAIANRVTYITRTDDQHLGVTIDYSDFRPKPDATTTAVELEVRKIRDFDELWNDPTFHDAIGCLGLNADRLRDQSSWTVVILEELKSKAISMGLGRLRWVLRTAMPLGPRFQLYLNQSKIESSKEDHTVVVDLDVSALPQNRLDALTSKTGEEWASTDGRLMAESFPLGISGEAKITQETLLGKSAEVLRSEGFFVYVRGRLVNEEDARFGLHALSHATLNRFRAIVHIDDLDRVVTANRESMEDVQLYRHAQYVLNEIFNEARQQYEDYLSQRNEPSERAKEDARNWVPEQLVEHPTADALSSYAQDRQGSEPDDSWMYLNVDPETDLDMLTRTLYARVDRGQAYQYRYTSRGLAERLVDFDPEDATFTINQDHDLAKAYASDPAAQRMLHDFVTGEALLEVYLREARLAPHLIGEVLEKRDRLFRGLANSQMFSLPALSTFIRESAANSRDLEVAVVAGARAMGFVAKHLGGPGQPDGIARFTDFPDGDQRIILEAKSSTSVPSAKDIDFASIATHVAQHNANGCLLVSPGYRGDDEGNTAHAARSNEISCWTTAQFADVIASVESRQISARQVLKIVQEAFAPDAVSEAVTELLAAPTWEPRALYGAVTRALRSVHELLPDSPRHVTLIAGEIARMSGFTGVKVSEIRRAIADLAGASQGALRLRDDNVVVLNVDYDELERRVQSLTGETGTPRRKGAFGALVRGED